MNHDESQSSEVKHSRKDILFFGKSPTSSMVSIKEVFHDLNMGDRIIGDVNVNHNRLVVWNLEHGFYFPQ